jgi:hypothetical protein
MFKNNLSEPEVIRNLISTVKRFDLINYLIEKYKVINYLEIGVFKGENIREIKAPHKDGVDPGIEGYVPPEVNYPMTSDNFFELIKGHDEIKYDLIFIDGLHHADQVAKDIQNGTIDYTGPYSADVKSKLKVESVNKKLDTMLKESFIKIK